MQARVSLQTIRRPRIPTRIMVRPKAMSSMDMTNVIVSVIALSAILDVGKTFYDQYQRAQDKKKDHDFLE